MLGRDAGIQLWSIISVVLCEPAPNHPAVCKQLPVYLGVSGRFRQVSTLQAKETFGVAGSPWGHSQAYWLGPQLEVGECLWVQRAGESGPARRRSWPPSWSSLLDSRSVPQFGCGATPGSIRGTPSHRGRNEPPPAAFCGWIGTWVPIFRWVGNIKCPAVILFLSPGVPNQLPFLLPTSRALPWSPLALPAGLTVVLSAEGLHHLVWTQSWIILKNLSVLVYT